MKSTITKLIPVAALCAIGVLPVLAQSADEEKEQKEREKVQAQAERVQAQAERAQEQAARVQERVQTTLEKTQEELGDRLNQIQDNVNKIVTRAGRAVLLAQKAPRPVSVPGAAGELPEPPEPPDVPDVDHFQKAVDQFQMRFDNGNGNFNWFGPGQPAAQPLIVNVSDPSPAKLAETQEDLNVMARILKKAAGRAGGRDKHEDEAAAMGIVLSNIPGGRRADSLYLEGHGAVFTLNVRFPLVAPAQVEEKKVEKAPDSTWENTKRELYGPRGAVVGFGGKGDLFLSNHNGGGPAMVYEAERVDSLKQELLAALKNGTNLRHVKPDEYVTVAVTGGTASTGNVTVQKVKPGKVRKKLSPPEPREDGDDDVKSAAPQLEVLTMSAPSSASGRQTNLIIRARKSDIDAFAKGELDLAAFTKKASMQVY